MVYFAVEHPCNKDCVELHRIKQSSNYQVLAEDLLVDHSFSSKPAGGYRMRRFVRHHGLHCGALGAQRGAVVWMVLREVFMLAAVGLAMSVPTAFGTSKVIEFFLFGMKPNDPLAMILAVAILLSAAPLASCVPARRASRIDPMAALRHE